MPQDSLDSFHEPGVNHSLLGLKINKREFHLNFSQFRLPLDYLAGKGGRLLLPGNLGQSLLHIGCESQTPMKTIYSVTQMFKENWQG